MPDEVGKKVRKVGTSLLALYGFFCMFTHYFSHGLAVHYGKSLYLEYIGKYPEHIYALQWVFESSLDFSSGLITGLSTGLIAGIALYVSVHYGVKRATVSSEFTQVGSIAFASYLGIFLVTSWIVNPFFLQSLFHTSHAIIFATVCFMVTWLYLHGGGKRRKRDHFFLLDKDVMLKRVELEHAHWKEIFHILAWGFVMLTVGMLATTIAQYYFVLPSEIRASTTFMTLLLITLLPFFVIAFGFIAGILFQILNKMMNITEVLKQLEE